MVREFWKKEARVYVKDFDFIKTKAKKASFDFRFAFLKIILAHVWTLNCKCKNSYRETNQWTIAVAYIKWYLDKGVGRLLHEYLRGSCIVLIQSRLEEEEFWESTGLLFNIYKPWNAFIKFKWWCWVGIWVSSSGAQERCLG